MPKPATEIVHWPGKDSPACFEHAEKLRALGLFMGFEVSSTPWIDDGTPCANCTHEEKKEAVT